MGRDDGEDDRELSEVPRVPLRGVHAVVVAAAMGVAGCDTTPTGMDATVIGIQDAPSSYDVHASGIDALPDSPPVEDEDAPPASVDAAVAGLDAIDSPPPVEPDAPPSDDER